VKLGVQPAQFGIQELIELGYSEEFKIRLTSFEPT